MTGNPHEQPKKPIVGNDGADAHVGLSMKALAEALDVPIDDNPFLNTPDKLFARSIIKDPARASILLQEIPELAAILAQDSNVQLQIVRLPGMQEAMRRFHEKYGNDFDGTVVTNPAVANALITNLNARLAQSRETINKLAESAMAQGQQMTGLIVAKNQSDLELIATKSELEKEKGKKKKRRVLGTLAVAGAGLAGFLASETIMPNIGRKDKEAQHAPEYPGGAKGSVSAVSEELQDDIDILTRSFRAAPNKTLRDFFNDPKRMLTAAQHAVRRIELPEEVLDPATKQLEQAMMHFQRHEATEGCEKMRQAAQTLEDHRKKEEKFFAENEPLLHSSTPGDGLSERFDNFKKASALSDNLRRYADLFVERGESQLFNLYTPLPGLQFKTKVTVKGNVATVAITATHSESDNPEKPLFESVPMPLAIEHTERGNFRLAEPDNPTILLSGGNNERGLLIIDGQREYTPDTLAQEVARELELQMLKRNDDILNLLDDGLNALGYDTRQLARGESNWGQLATERFAKLFAQQKLYEDRRLNGDLREFRDINGFGGAEIEYLTMRSVLNAIDFDSGLKTTEAFEGANKLAAEGKYDKAAEAYGNLAEMIDRKVEEEKQAKEKDPWVVKFISYNIQQHYARLTTALRLISQEFGEISQQPEIDAEHQGRPQQTIPR